jgi:hypothetical protein
MVAVAVITHVSWPTKSVVITVDLENLAESIKLPKTDELQIRTKDPDAIPYDDMKKREE